MPFFRTLKDSQRPSNVGLCQWPQSRHYRCTKLQIPGTSPWCSRDRTRNDSVRPACAPKFPVKGDHWWSQPGRPMNFTESGCLPAEIHQDGLFHMTQKYPKIPIFESFSLSMSFLSYHMIIVCLTNIPGCFPQLERLKDSINSHNKRWVVLIFGTFFFVSRFCSENAPDVSTTIDVRTWGEFETQIHIKFIKCGAPSFAPQQNTTARITRTKKYPMTLGLYFPKKFLYSTHSSTFRQVAKRKVTWVFRKWPVPVPQWTGHDSQPTGPFHHRTQELSTGQLK